MAFFLLFIILIGLLACAAANRRNKPPKNKNRKREETFHELDQRLRLERQDRQEMLVSRSKTLKKEIKSAIKKYKYSLQQEKDRLVIYDAYGNSDRSEWDMEGVPYFINKVLRPELGLNSIDWKDVSALCSEDPESGISKLIDEELEHLATGSQTNSNEFEETMGGIEYEYFCKQILMRLNFDVTITKASGDQGVDLIASKEGIRVCIQCKRYASPVGNSAVQEVTAGKIHWKGTHAVVVTNAGFTRSAQALARSTGVLLMSHEELEDLENRL